MPTIQDLLKSLSEIESKIGYHFHNQEDLFLAFIHRSFINENREIIVHNERLEFLGDAILGLLMAEYLYCNFPDIPEGDLSYLRSRLVEASSCVLYVQKINLGQHLLLGKGESMNDGRGRESILADLLEAVVGAIYLDGGMQAARNFIFDNFSKEIAAIIERPIRNWKSLLQDFCQKTYQQTPLYHLISQSGPDHSKVFNISVTIDNKEVGYGQGASKKEAQQAAAENALSNFKLI